LVVVCKYLSNFGAVSGAIVYCEHNRVGASLRTIKDEVVESYVHVCRADWTTNAVQVAIDVRLKVIHIDVKLTNA